MQLWRGWLGPVLLFLFLVFAMARPAWAKLFEVHSFRLANGLQVVVLPNHRAPIVTQMVWYKVGAADEPRGKSGIAHFLEHLMFRGTKATPPGAFTRIVARNGGRDNAFTTHDATVFYEDVAAERLPLVMKLEADRMASLVITTAAVTPEREVILEERRQRIDNSPAALFKEQLQANLFLHHPYGIPTIGWKSETQALTAADARAFYRRWYAPNNALLVIGGDVKVSYVKALAEKYYGSIAARAVPTRHRVSEPPKVAATRLTMKSPRVAQISWTRQYLAPSYRAGETQYAYALQVLAWVLGGGADSPLYKGLVVDRPLAASAGAFYNPDVCDLAVFGFAVRLRSGVSVADFEKAFGKILRRALQGGVSARDVARAKARMQSAAIYARDSLSGPARIVGQALAIGQSVDDIEHWPERIGSVTLAQVEAAAHLIIRDNVAVTGVLVPEPAS